VHLGAGLACGSTGIAAGYAIGIVGDSVRVKSQDPLSIVLNIACVVCPRLRARIQSVRGDGPYPHIRRSSWLVWVRPYCCRTVWHVIETRTC